MSVAVLVSNVSSTPHDLPSLSMLLQRLKPFALPPDQVACCQTLGDLQALVKQRYRTLAKRYHPDHLGEYVVNHGHFTPDDIATMYELSYTDVPLATIAEQFQTTSWYIGHLIRRYNPTYRLSTRDRAVLLVLHKRGWGYNRLSTLFGVHKSNIQRVITNKRLRHRQKGLKVTGGTFQRLTTLYRWCMALTPASLPLDALKQREKILFDYDQSAVPWALERPPLALGYGWQETPGGW